MLPTARTPVDAWMLPGALSRPAGRSGARRTTRDWLVDLAAFLLAVGWALGELQSLRLNVFALPQWLLVLDPALGVAACLAVWWRRRFPTALTAAVGAACAISNTAAGALFVLLFTVALHRGWTRAVPLVLGTAVLSVPYIYSYLGVVFGSPLLMLLAILLMMLLSVTAGLAVRARRQLVLSLREQVEAERREHGLRLAAAQRAERQRIAREMHDVLAHRISLLSVHAGALEYRLGRAREGIASPPSPQELGEAAGVVRSTAHQALEELQQVLRLLRGPDVDARDREDGRAAPQPTLAQLPRLLDEARAGGQRVDAELPDDLDALPQAVQRTLFRVVQEALTNARKHAPGARVVLSGRAERGGEAVLRVSNAVPVGVTAAEIPGAGTGLLGLAERVAVHGGELASGVDRGEFRVCARVPWPR
ncbi:sensor histidine kinase [Pseudonocardia humida]|uniref:histidine kinase n=1 Tax=Pseudonocardia humida TaxID=2800819 RepID=A0ABT1AAG1_9PSEU|nr:histidine kinase [Pseudonocardia humida]MCO1660009.1 histidine kinase [Pseudonocardia humida]